MTISIDLTKDPVRPGEQFRINIKSDDDLIDLTAQVKDSNENIRLLMRGKEIGFESLWPKTRLSGDWTINVIGRSKDGGKVETSSSLQVILDETNYNTKSVIDDRDMKPKETSEIEESVFTTPDVPPETENINELMTANEDDNTSAYHDNISETSVLDEQIEYSEQEPLTDVSGIGKATQSKLYAAGLNTISEVANASIDQLISVGIQEKQAETIIENAKSHIS